MKPTFTAKQIRERFQTNPAAFIVAVKSLPSSVGDYWEKISESANGKKVTRRIAYVGGPELKAFVRSLPQGQEREMAAALSQTLATVASGLSVLETGVYRLTEGTGKFPWKVEGSHEINFSPGMAAPPPKAAVKEFPVNAAFAAAIAAAKEERERIEAEAETARLAARDAAAAEVRDAAAAVQEAEEKHQAAARAAVAARGKNKAVAAVAATSASDALRAAETILARKRAIAAAI